MNLLKIIVDCDCDIYCDYEYVGHVLKEEMLKLELRQGSYFFEFKRDNVSLKKEQYDLKTFDSSPIWRVSVASEVLMETFTINGVSFDMITVKGGTFNTGSVYSKSNPPHSVTLTSYKIGKFPVTQKLWRAVLGGYDIDMIDKRWKGSLVDYAQVGDNYPMVMINHVLAEKFIASLNRITGRKFAIPTLAQWEFAAIGGTSSKGYIYSGSNNLDDVGWYYENSGRTLLDEANWAHRTALSNNNRIHIVGGKKPNELGIYDMSGNCWELCADRDQPIPAIHQINPTGAPKQPISPGERYGNLLTKRGGSVRESSRHSAIRTYSSSFECELTETNNSLTGLRLVLLD